MGYAGRGETAGRPKESRPQFLHDGQDLLQALHALHQNLVEGLGHAAVLVKVVGDEGEVRTETRGFA